MWKYKWWIIAGVCLVIGGALAGILIAEDKNNDDPLPPPPVPPAPAYYNPYEVLPMSVTNYEYKVTGTLKASTSSSHSSGLIGDDLIKADPRMIP